MACAFSLIVLTLASSLPTHAALTATVSQWGSNYIAQANRPASLTNISAIAAGSDHALAVRADGTVIGWGATNWNKHLPPAGLSNVVAVAAGYNHSLALRSDGSVVTWGDPTMTNTPGFSSSFPAYAIAAGEYFSMGLWNNSGNGNVAVWGAAPPSGGPSDLNYVTAIAAGRSFCVAVKQVGGTGRVVVWGNGAPQPPVYLTDGSHSVLAVAAGEAHCVALLSDYSLVAWGNNNFYQQLNIPAGAYSIIGIAAYGNYTLARRSDGAIFGWGENYLGASSPPSGLSNVVAVATGNGHALALYWEPLVITSQPQNATSIVGQAVSFTAAATGSETITYQWRRNGTNIAAATNATYTIASVQTNHAGSYTVMMVNPVSTVISAAATLVVYAPPAITNSPQSQTVPQGSIVSFSVGASGTTPFSYQWRKDGTNLAGATSNPFIIPNAQTNHAGNYTVVITNIAGAVTSAPATLNVLVPPVISAHPQSQTVLAGSAVSFSVTASGADTYQWRKNNQDISGATGSIYTINAAQTNDAGNYRVVVANGGGSVLSNPAQLTVLAPGTNINLVPWGQDLAFNGSAWVDLTPPAGLSNVVALAVGGSHSLALLRDGTVVGWGDNSYGQASASGLTGVRAIAAGLNHSLALKVNGTVVAWGRNNFGQTNVVGGLTDVKAIAAGANHCLVLRTNGIIAGWGDNANGKASAFPTATNAMAIAAGAEHSLVLRSNGTVVAWGGNDDGQLQVPLGLSNVVAIAAGDHHSLALRADGTVVAWGAARPLYNYGQATVPANLGGVAAIAAGGTHSLALLKNNTVAGWGADNYGQATAPANLTGVAAIAAGPNRSLALRLKSLRLQRLEQVAGGAFRLTLGNADGSALEAERLSRIVLYSSSNAALSLSQWTARANAFTLNGNSAVYAETNSATVLQRYYLVTERP